MTHSAEDVKRKKDGSFEKFGKKTYLMQKGLHGGFLENQNERIIQSLLQSLLIRSRINLSKSVYTCDKKQDLGAKQEKIAKNDRQTLDKGFIQCYNNEVNSE